MREVGTLDALITELSSQPCDADLSRNRFTISVDVFAGTGWFVNVKRLVLPIPEGKWNEVRNAMLEGRQMEVTLRWKDE